MKKIKMVRREGGSRVLSVSDVIPKDWQAVETETSKTTRTSVTVIITKVK